MKWSLIAILLCLSLSGCSSYIQAVDGYATVAAESAQDTTDLNLKAIKFSLCATPFSAIVRNPEFAGAIKELCLGNTNTTVEELLSGAKTK